MVFFDLLRKRRRQVDRCVLDIPLDKYDLHTGLPTTIQVGDREITPYVSLQEVRDHLTFLTAVWDLQSSFTSQTGGTISVDDLLSISTEPYVHWVQHILPQHGSNALSPQTSLVETELVQTSPGQSDDRDVTAGNEELEVNELPSLGVLMAWHAHLLNPAQYESDLAGTFKALRGIKFPLSHIATAIRDGSLPPIDPISIDRSLQPSATAKDMSPGREAVAKSEWTARDVALAVQRQGKFVGHMKRIGWLEEGYWHRRGSAEVQFGVVLYHAWLDLMHATSSKHFLVPRLDIDLAWHTHQLDHERYKEDTAALLGEMLDHNDAAGDDELGDGLEVTKRLWKKRFGYAYM
ncbi:hypothetical protein IAU59_007314 [Kwoniella sp. CBS 9459]